MSNPLFERLQSTASMMAAEQELIALGEDAIPILENLLDGSSKNHLGVPYRNLGLPLRCALEVCIRLGSIAKPLEAYLQEEMRDDNPVAARALAALGSLDEVSIALLANSLGSTQLEVSFEAAAALIQGGYAEHPSSLQAVASSERAAITFARVAAFIAKTRT